MLNINQNTKTKQNKIKNTVSWSQNIETSLNTGKLLNVKYKPKH